MKKKKRGLNIHIHFSNRWLYFLITLGILMIVGVGVYAAVPNPGHSIDEIDSSVTDMVFPHIVLDSTGNGDDWTSQGAYISIGESGDLGSASMHMTYRGDGYGFIGSGEVSNGIPGASYLRFDYNSDNIYTPDTLRVGNNYIYGSGNYGFYTSGFAYGVYSYGTTTGVRGFGGTYGVLGSGDVHGVRGRGAVGVYGNGDRGVMGVGDSTGATGVVGWGYGNDFLADGPGTNYAASSSIRWKTNITEIPNALEKIMKLRGVYFDWNGYNNNTNHDMGFIAEEVGEIIPEIVGYDDKTNKSNWYTDSEGNKKLYATGVDYGALTPMLVEAIKELKEENDKLKSELCSKNNSYSWC